MLGVVEGNHTQLPAPSDLQIVRSPGFPQNHEPAVIPKRREASPYPATGREIEMDITQAETTDTVTNQSESPSKYYYGKRNNVESTMSENAETRAADWRPESPRFDTEAQVALERARSTAQVAQAVLMVIARVPWHTVVGTVAAICTIVVVGTSLHQIE